MAVRRIPTAGHMGAFTAHVEGDRIVGVTPFEADPSPTPLAAAWAELLDAPHRVRRPAIRRGWLEAHERGDTAAKPGGRGHEPFVEVPWDEALDIVASEIADVRAAHGNSALFGGSYGWAGAGRVNHARSLLQRFMWAIGGHTGQITNYSYGAAMVLLPRIVGDEGAVTGAVTDFDTIAAHCDHLVAFGGLAGKNWQIQSGGNGLHLFDAWMAKLRERGVRLTNVSAMRSDLADQRAEWLPIRPGTDTALILALSHVVIEAGTVDWETLERCTVGAERFIAYVTGKLDGIAKTPEWAAPITGLTADVILDLARALIGKRVMLTATWSLQRAEHGEQPYWAVISLAAILGQIGLPGGGFAFGYGSMGGFGNRPYRTPLQGIPVPRRTTDVMIPVARVADMLLEPGARIPFKGGTVIYPEIELVYWSGGNPFHHHQDLNRLSRALARPRTFVVHEIFWTATARRADIVLPATSPLERDDVTGSSRDPYLLAMHKVREPVGDARDDFAIHRDLARRLGVEDDFTEGLTQAQWLRRCYEQSRSRLAERGIEAPEFEEFWRRGHFRLPEPETGFNMLGAFRDDPQGNPLATPSGRIELFSKEMAALGLQDFPGHAAWREPREWSNSQRYPLHLITNQPPDKLHSQLDGSALSRAAEIAGRAAISMHPDDAAARDLADRAVVRVHNDRGACLAGLRLEPGIMRGVVAMATGATLEMIDTAQGPLEIHGNPNVLTRDIGTSGLGQGSSALTCMVEVERWFGPVPRVTVFDPPDFVCRTEV